MTDQARALIGIMGGTFDPIHFGHLRVALELTEQLSLSQLRLVPCHKPPHRQTPHSDSSHRLAMVRLAVEGEDSLVVDDCELDRLGPSYTVKTLEFLRDQFNSDYALCLAMGADAFIGLPTWHRWQEIRQLVHIVVMTRPGWQIPDNSEMARYLRRFQVHKPAQLHREPAGRILLQPVTALSISATSIRQQIAQGHSPRYLLPDCVYDYIRQHGLYANVSLDP